MFSCELRERDGDGVGFLAGRAPRYPGPDRLIRRALLDELGKDSLLQDFERFGVAEKTGHVDQDVLIQRLDFRCVLAQETSVSLGAFQLVQYHAPPNPPAQGL